MTQKTNDPVRELIDALPKLTPDQDAMFDERGDLIPTPENPEGSITVLRMYLHSLTPPTLTEKTQDG